MALSRADVQYAPVVLMLRDGSAALMVRADPERNIVWLRDPLAPENATPVPVDELRLSEVWTGDILLVKRRCDLSEADARFDMMWFAKIVLREKVSLRNIVFASMILAVLQIFPALIVMQMVDRVVNYHSTATLISITGIVVIFTFYEIMLTYARRELTLVMTTRLNARIFLYVFNRLLSLPLEFYEREQTERVIGRYMALYRVRDFLTGKLLSTFLDMFTLFVILPVLFYMSTTLAWMTLACAGLIDLIVVVFLPPMTRVYSKMVDAEMERGSVLYETVAGIRTIKTLALEQTRRKKWDETTANVIRWKLASGRMSNWPATLVMPLDMFINRGIILVGAYLALKTNSGVGALLAFMMLGSRVASPLVSLAKILEDVNQVTTLLNEAGIVLNQPTETKALTTGMRPILRGALSFQNVDFTYPGSSNKALNNVTFEVPAGTMLGLVGWIRLRQIHNYASLTGCQPGHTGFLRLDALECEKSI